MKFHHAPLALLTAIFMTTCVEGKAHSSPYVVIKADDLVYRPDENVFGSGWNRFIQLIHSRKISASIGIICNSLEGENAEYYDRIKQVYSEGKIEFWNHGYTHWRNKEATVFEFSGRDREAQREAINQGQLLAREKLGFTFSTFGAPFNAVDAITAEVIQSQPEIKVWLYGPASADLGDEQMVLKRTAGLDIEFPVHHPNFEKFKVAFANHITEPYMILQVHPGGWDAERFSQFEQILDLMITEKVTFVPPSQLYRILASDPTSG